MIDSKFNYNIKVTINLNMRALMENIIMDNLDDTLVITINISGGRLNYF